MCTDSHDGHGTHHDSIQVILAIEFYLVSTKPGLRFQVSLSQVHLADASLTRSASVPVLQVTELSSACPSLIVQVCLSESACPSLLDRPSH
jgi:hypothetical protein